MTATTIIPEVTKEIKFNRETKDYDLYITIDGERMYIGSAPNYSEGESRCREYAYDYYSDRNTPEKAAQIALAEPTPDSSMRYDPNGNALIWECGKAAIVYDLDTQAPSLIALRGECIDFKATEIGQLRDLVRLLFRPDVLRALGLSQQSATALLPVHA
jgi:hypothetical protein